MLLFLVQSNFCCEEHIKYILSVCSQRVYLMKLLRVKGLPPPQLQHICQALIISRILYAVSAWGGFLSDELKNRINGFFLRLYRYGYTPALVDMEQLLRDADKTLFCKALKDVHCLHHLLPQLKTPHIQLRPANHNYHLPICKYELYKRSFIVRSLFSFNFNYQ